MINIKTDSNKIIKGDIFIALKGFNKDGHGFIQKAIQNGATKIIAEHGEYEVETTIVSDTRKYLVNYLKNKYSHYLKEMTFIGITGTNGKTTTSFLIYQTLNIQGIKCSYIGTIGYYKEQKIKNLVNTSPDIAELYELIIDSYESGYKYIVMEVSSQGLANHRFDSICFDIALFTNLTQDHLDYHITMENYAYTKRELFKKLKTTGKAIINIDSRYSKYYLMPNNKNITYGFNKSNYHIINYKTNIDGSFFKYSHNNIIYEVYTNLIGKYNIYNLISAISVTTEIGLKTNDIIDAIPLLEPPKGRMEKIDFNNNLIIIDYAHTPDAIYNIINTVKEFTEGNVYVVFGCTGNKDRSKRHLMTEIVLSSSKKAIITSDDVYSESTTQIVNDMLENNIYDNYKIELDRKKAIKKAICFLNQKDTLLILGKGNEDFLIIDNKKYPYNDKDVILKCIEETFYEKC